MQAKKTPAPRGNENLAEEETFSLEKGFPEEPDCLIWTSLPR